MANRTIAPKDRRNRLRILRDRDGDNCWICGEALDFSLPRDHDEAWSFDHVVSRRDGGVNAARNLRLAHRICNSVRGKNA